MQLRPPHVRDGCPAGVQGHVKGPGCRLAEQLLAYREAHCVPVVFAHVQRGLEGTEAERDSSNAGTGANYK